MPKESIDDTLRKQTLSSWGKREWAQPTSIEGNEVTYDSPFEEWPGSITLPRRLSAAQFENWWKLINEESPETDNLHWAQRHWQQRFDWIIDLKLKGIKSTDIEKTGAKLPDNRILLWYGVLTERIVVESLSLPN